MLIFEHSRSGRRNYSQSPLTPTPTTGIPEKLLRKAPPLLPEVSEMDAVRHYTRLSQKNFSIDTQFYPLGSCTMKYNPRACNSLAGQGVELALGQDARADGRGHAVTLPHHAPLAPASSPPCPTARRPPATCRAAPGRSEQRPSSAWCPHSP